MTKRAVLYARVSGDDRRTATSSIDGQLADCRAYAAEMGYQVIGEYHEERDRLTSGADWLPELDKVMNLARQRAFDVLIAWKMDRLARNRFKQLSIENALTRASVAVEYAKESYDDTPEGRLLKGLKGQLAEWELETIRERMVNGMLRSVDNGNVKLSVVTYGYEVKVKDKRRTLVINEAEAAVIRLIFDLYVNRHYTIYAIAKFLDEHKIPKPASEQAGWSHGTLNNILKNETYVGRWYYRKTRYVKDPVTGKKKRVACPKSEWMLVNVPAIVSEAIFKAAQQRRQTNKSRGKQRVNVYALGGRLKCWHCGNGMSGITRKDRNGRRYYVCNIRHGKGRFTTAGPCPSPYYNGPEVDAAVWGWVKSILLDPDRLQQELQNYQERQAANLRPLLDMIEANEKQLARLEAEKERLIKAYAAGVLSLDEIAKEKTGLDKRINDIGRANQELRAELEPKLLSQRTRENIESYAAKIRAGVELVDDEPETQREIYRLLNLAVTLSCVDGRKWADVTCVLGENHVPAEFSVNDFAAPSPG